MTSKQTATPRAKVASDRAGLEALIEAAAKGKGTMTIKALIPGCAANAKGITDKVRRMPRVKGWKALGVTVVEADASSITMEVTCEGAAAAAWPVRPTIARKGDAPAKATAKKATAKKASTKKATPAKRAAKASKAVK